MIFAFLKIGRSNENGYSIVLPSLSIKFGARCAFDDGRMRRQGCMRLSSSIAQAKLFMRSPLTSIALGIFPYPQKIWPESITKACCRGMCVEAKEFLSGSNALDGENHEGSRGRRPRNGGPQSA